MKQLSKSNKVPNEEFNASLTILRTPPNDYSRQNKYPALNIQ